MKWFILLISAVLLSVVNARPQQQQYVAAPVELEKQVIIELPSGKAMGDNPSQRKIEENTKEILEKIAEVNKRQGLMSKRSKPSYFQFPFSYSRAENKADSTRTSTSFKFPTSPFTNPIFEYLENQNNNNARNEIMYREEPLRGYEISSVDPNAKITKDDIVPGQYIKRKITHQQTYLMPLAVYQMPPPQMPMGYPMENRHNPMMNLEQQTVENIKNIVSSSQFQQSPYMNPYPGYNYQLYGPFSEYDLRPGRQQQWQWPGAQYFPIIIRDPLLQMFNAITSVVDYGPMATIQGGGCKNKPTKNKVQEKIVTEEPARTPKISDEFKGISKIQFNMGGESATSEVTIVGIEDAPIIANKTYLDIENLNIASSEDEPLKFTVNLQTEQPHENSKALKTSWEQKPKDIYNTTTRQLTGSKLEKFSDFTTPKSKLATNQHLFKQSPPIREQTLLDDELDKEEDEEDEKAEDISIVNDNNKKTFTRENTGSGIFIHKLKVRKGGVAIAGPGGIATAGSGGTAIVGPNGVAYTHPDSLAIAGSGTKVVAVDPLINLSDLISNTTRTNRTKLDVNSSRVGKVVAVGPVIYYNRG